MFTVETNQGSYKAPKIHLASEDASQLQADGSLLPIANNLFRENGVLIIDNILPKSQIEIIHSYFFQHYQAYTVVGQYTNTLRVGDKRKMITIDIEDCFNDSSLYANPLLMSLLESQLGKGFVLGSFGVVCSFPRAKDQHVHIDHYPLFYEQQVHVPLPCYAVNIVIPLVDLTIETGTTRVWKGSHQKAFDEQIAIESSDVVLVEKGACYLMDYQLTHGGTANLSSLPRPILYMTYCRPWFVETVNYEYQKPVSISQREYQKVPEPYKFLFEREKRIYQIERNAVESYIKRNQPISNETSHQSSWQSKRLNSLSKHTKIHSIGFNQSSLTLLFNLFKNVALSALSKKPLQQTPGSYIDTTIETMIEDDGSEYICYQPKGKQVVILSVNNWISYDLFYTLFNQIKVQQFVKQLINCHDDLVLYSALISIGLDACDLAHETGFRPGSKSFTILVSLPVTNGSNTHIICRNKNDEAEAFNLMPGTAVIIGQGVSYTISGNSKNKCQNSVISLLVGSNKVESSTFIRNSIFRLPSFFVLSSGQQYRRWYCLETIKYFCNAEHEHLKWAAQYFDFFKIRTITDCNWSQTFKLTNTADQDAYLKVLPSAQHSEAKSTALISKQLPESTPQVIAYDATKRYLLTKGHGGTDLEVWSLGQGMKLLLALAELEAKASKNQELITHLPSYEIKHVFNDLINSLAGEPSSNGSGIQLRTLATQFLEDQVRLYYLEKLQVLSAQMKQYIQATQKLPSTIIHGDCQADNAAELQDGRIAFYDWGEVFVGPAGLSISNPLLIDNFRLAIQVIEAFRELDTEIFEQYVIKGRKLVSNKRSWRRITQAIGERELYKFVLAAYIDELEKKGYCDKKTILLGLPGAILAGQIFWLVNWCIGEEYKQSGYALIKDWWIPVLDDLIGFGEQLSPASKI